MRKIDRLGMELAHYLALCEVANQRRDWNARRYYRTRIGQLRARMRDEWHKKGHTGNAPEQRPLFTGDLRDNSQSSKGSIKR